MSFHGPAVLEDNLMDRLRVGEPNALTTLYLRYAKSLHSVFLFMTRDERTAEDLTQEFFLRLAGKANLFNAEKGNLEVWLRSIARNMAIDQLRSAASKLERLFVSPDDVERMSCHNDPLQSLVIKQALLRLNPAHRQLLELAYFDGYSHIEIAALLNRPLGTVKSNIRSAHLELARAFRTRVQVKRPLAA